METIKNFFVGVAEFAYNFFIDPIVQLRHFFKMEAGQKVFSVLQAMSHATILLSFFFAVPTFLVVLAWIWFAVELCFIACIVALGLANFGMFASMLAKMKEDAAKAANDAAPEQAAAPAGA